MIHLTKQGNQNWHVLTLGQHRLYFSYATLVAYDGPLGALRTSTRHSRTTSRQMTRNLPHTSLRGNPWVEVEPSRLEHWVMRWLGQLDPERV